MWKCDSRAINVRAHPGGASWRPTLYQKKDWLGLQGRPGEMEGESGSRQGWAMAQGPNGETGPAAICPAGQRGIKHWSRMKPVIPWPKSTPRLSDHPLPPFFRQWVWRKTEHSPPPLLPLPLFQVCTPSARVHSGLSSTLWWVGKARRFFGGMYTSNSFRG